MVAVKPNRTFVYGNFFVGKKQPSGPPAPPPGLQPFALEILREFSTTEFIGKLYIRSGGSWLPATRMALQEYKWYTIYQSYQRLPFLMLSKLLHFNMEGSGVWQVQHLREESDDTGPYVAVAMRFGGSKPSGG